MEKTAFQPSIGVQIFVNGRWSPFRSFRSYTSTKEALEAIKRLSQIAGARVFRPCPVAALQLQDITEVVS